MKRLLALLVLLPAVALAQPQCAPTSPNSIACQAAASNLQPTDVVLGQQAVGPNRPDQTVRIPLSSIAGLPGGSPTNVQYNASSALGGDSTFTFNSSTKAVTAQSLTVTGVLTGTLTGGASLDLPLTGGTLTGALTLAAPTASGYSQGISGVTPNFNGGATPSILNYNANPVGTVTSGGPYCIYCFTIPNDTTTSTNLALDAVRIDMNLGAAVAGGKAALNVLFSPAATITNTGGNPFWTGINVQMLSSHAITTNGANFIAFSPQVSLTSGATGYGLAEAIEAGVQVFTGASIAGGRYGVTMFSGGDVQGDVANGDVGFTVSGEGSPADHIQVGWMYGYSFGRVSSPWGIDPNGTLIGPQIQLNGSAANDYYRPQAAAYGADFASVNFSSYAYTSPGFQVDPNGCLYSGDASLCTSSTTTTLDMGGYTDTDTTINGGQAGVGFAANDQVYTPRPYGGIATLTVNGSGNVTSFVWTRSPHCFGGSCPATLTMLGGTGYSTGSPLVFNATWTQGLTLGLGTVNATAVNLGNSGSTTNLIGALQAGGTAGVTCAAGVPSSSFTTKNGIVTHC